jgi:hypothetical protein
MVAVRAVVLGINVLSLNYVASNGLRINKNNSLAAYDADCCQIRRLLRLFRAGLDSKRVSE